MIGAGCAWCGLPAVARVEVQPAQYRTLTRKDPITGRRVAHQESVRAAIRVPVCGEHEHITRGQPAPVPVPRTASDVEQLGMFPATAEERLRNAIYREIGR